MKRWISLACGLLAALALTGCATQKAATDYSAYKQHLPHSILVLPPVNNTSDIRATYSLASTVTVPIAEQGYYVFPIALVDQTFKDNGFFNAAEMHAVPLPKLKEIFSADAVLYITIDAYGAQHALLGGAVVVRARANLVDIATGTQLWQGEASASDDENRQQNQGLLGMLITGIIKQVADTLSDPGRHVAATTNWRLLRGGTPLLPGPRAKQTEQAVQTTASAEKR